jgi:hypothetical protein
MDPLAHVPPQGVPTSHVAAFGSRLGGGRRMGLAQRTANLLQAIRLARWRRRVLRPSVDAFRLRFGLPGDSLEPCRLREQARRVARKFDSIVPAQPLLFLGHADMRSDDFRLLLLLHLSRTPG